MLEAPPAAMLDDMPWAGFDDAPAAQLEDIPVGQLKDAPAGQPEDIIALLVPGGDGAMLEEATPAAIDDVVGMLGTAELVEDIGREMTRAAKWFARYEGVPVPAFM